MPRPQTTPASPKTVQLLESWAVALAGGQRSLKTIATYGESGRSFVDFCEREGLPADAASIERAHIERWLADLGRTRAPGTVSVRYRSLRQFWKWAALEGEIPSDPMKNIAAPIVPEVAVPVLSAEQVRALLKACDGASFDDRRDYALISLLFDSGLRRGEVAGLTLKRVDLAERVVHVLGKGRRERVVPFGVKTAAALDRYKRMRSRHPHASLDAFWIGQRGAVSDSGVSQIIERRGRQAGLGRVHAHQLRHSFAHAWLAGGGEETNLMDLAGWKSRQMLQRYAASTRAERARDAHRRHSPGDKL